MKKPNRIVSPRDPFLFQDGTKRVLADATFFDNEIIVRFADDVSPNVITLRSMAEKGIRAILRKQRFERFHKESSKAYKYSA